MDKNEQIEQLVRKALDQFEHPETLSPNPYLYTRIRQQVEVRSERRGTVSAIVRPALLTALVVLNMVVGYWYLTGGQRQTQTNTRQELIDLLSGDLNLDGDHTNFSITQ